MGDRGSTPAVPGLLTGFVTPSVVPIQVAHFASANRLTRVSFRVTDPPTGGSVTVQLNTASDGSGSSISVTIPDGQRFATAIGSVAIPAGGALYQRITAESGAAMNLSGEYEVELSSGITAFLTSLALVKIDAGIAGTDADRDTLLNAWIAGATKQIQNAIGRPITQTTTTGERIDSPGVEEIYAHHFPILSVQALYELGTLLVEGTDFELTELDKVAGRIVRISGTGAAALPVPWLSGRRAVTLDYTHGFASVPDDLVWAATHLVVARFHETAKSGRGWRGLASMGVDPNAATAFDKEIWHRDVVPVLRNYVRLSA